MPPPFVSVITAVYNGAATLRRAIQSVLKQTYTGFELIIVDDCSTEDIAAAVKAFNDSRIIYIRHSENKGAGAARNTGMRQARGTLLAFLDSDDEFLPEKLSEQIALWQRLPATGLVITNLRGQNSENDLYLPARIQSGYVTAAHFPGSVFTPPSTWLLAKELTQSVGFFDEAIDIIEDADYFARILAHARIYFLSQALAIKHTSRERKGHFSARHFSGNKLFLTKHLARLRRDRKYFSHFYYLMAKDYYLSGQPQEAKKYYLEAFATSPKISYLFKYLRCF